MASEEVKVTWEIRALPSQATTTAVVGERIEIGVKPKKVIFKRQSSFLVPQNPEGQQEPQADS